MIETYQQIKADITELLRSQLEELKDEDKAVDQTKQVPIIGPDGRPLSRRQKKRLEKRQRRLERSTLRKMKDQPTDEEVDTPRNGADRSPVKNDDTEQALSM